MDKFLIVEGYPKFIGLPEASLYALLGFLVVFLGISFLILIVWAVGKFMQKGAPVAKKAEPAPVKKNNVVSVPTPVNEDEVSEETVAVITAAIMAYYEKNNPKCEFTVRRIKKF